MCGRAFRISPFQDQYSACSVCLHPIGAIVRAPQWGSVTDPVCQL